MRFSLLAAVSALTLATSVAAYPTADYEYALARGIEDGKAPAPQQGSDLKRSGAIRRKGRAGGGGTTPTQQTTEGQPATPGSKGKMALEARDLDVEEIIEIIARGYYDEY